MYAFGIISPDGKQIILKNPENQLCLYQIADGNSSVLKNLDSGFYFSGWLDDCQSIFVRQWGTLPTVIYKYSLVDGTKKKWIEIMPKNPNGVKQLSGIRITPNCETYVYHFNREFSDLYLMEDPK